jgi:hypothetical protein
VVSVFSARPEPPRLLPEGPKKKKSPGLLAAPDDPTPFYAGQEIPRRRVSTGASGALVAVVPGAPTSAALVDATGLIGDKHFHFVFGILYGL